MRNRLKVLRAERDWTQAQLAGELDVSRQTVNAIETGKFDPSLPLAFKIARLFTMSIEQVFEPEAAQPPTATGKTPKQPASPSPDRTLVLAVYHASSWEKGLSGSRRRPTAPPTTSGQRPRHRTGHRHPGGARDPPNAAGTRGRSACTPTLHGTSDHVP